MSTRSNLARALGFIVACSAFAGSSAHAAGASQYPERPVRLVIGFPPGGTADTFARIMASRLQEALGQPWIVDNRPGAAGNIASEIVATASPDGHTVLLALSSMLTVNPTLYKLNFDVEKDLQPVSLLASSQYLLVAHPSTNANTVAEFITLAKAQPGKLNYASIGVGSPHHLAAELFKLRSGIDMIHVPYKGGGPAAAAVVGNEVQALFGSLASLLPHVKGGRVNALAVTSASRSGLLPDVPTIAESGLPGFDVSSWQSFLVPAKTPRQIVETLYKASAKVLDTPEVRTAIQKSAGLEAIAMDPEAFAGHIKKETAVWRELIKRVNIQLK